MLLCQDEFVSALRVKAWKYLPGIEKIQYILFEILTEGREGWTGQPAGLARSPPSELRTPAHLFWGGFRHGKYWQNLQAQG